MDDEIIQSIALLLNKGPMNGKEKSSGKQSSVDEKRDADI
jgi:hypothetical protein